MAQVNTVNKQVRMTLDEIIRFQLITHCYIHNLVLSELDLDCLMELGKLGESELTEFCNLMAEKRLAEKLLVWKPNPDNPREKKPEASSQTIRNVLIKIEKEKLLVKSGQGRKKITLNPLLQIQTGGNILLNYKLVHIDSQKT